MINRHKGECSYCKKIKLVNYRIRYKYNNKLIQNDVNN